jgi:hypothetical protein
VDGLPLLLVIGALSAAAPDYRTLSCAELASLRAETETAAARLADWMERHCPGDMESTEPFCRMQSGLLMDRLAELGEVKSAMHAKQCEVQ